MKLTTLLTPLLLTLTHPTPTTATGPNEMVTKDYQNAITCGKKNADINYLIDLFCTSSAHGTPRESNGFHLGQPAWYNLRFPARNGWRLQIAGPHCPKDQLWVPAKFCEAQFHYIQKYNYEALERISNMKAHALAT
ncbi:hypothetical protein B0A50_08685 [Salinomyces thailandicus]|uniref:Uncharacterized protein n=1 Tax=Salinomyces thailandicus TaxID=706561 RepID=A0A4U0TIY7_9PEZI|nr:hypothetical protein B0A50_08685 [Salinomyces thailandica]